MVFDTFRDFQDWCIEHEEITVGKPRKDDVVKITHIKETNGMIMTEALVLAHHSGFTLGAMHTDIGKGSILITDH